MLLECTVGRITWDLYAKCAVRRIISQGSKTRRFSSRKKIFSSLVITSRQSADRLCLARKRWKLEIFKTGIYFSKDRKLTTLAGEMIVFYITFFVDDNLDGEVGMQII